jgi:hypothetical protein
MQVIKQTYKTKCIEIRKAVVQSKHFMETDEFAVYEINRVRGS